MADTYWSKNGKYIVDADGKFIMCSHCPCSTVIVFDCSQAPGALEVFNYREDYKMGTWVKCLCGPNDDGTFTIKYKAACSEDDPNYVNEEVNIIVNSDGKMRVGAHPENNGSYGTHGGVNYDDGGPTIYKVTWPLGSVNV